MDLNGLPFFGRTKYATQGNKGMPNPYGILTLNKIAMAGIPNFEKLANGGPIISDKQFNLEGGAYVPPPSPPLIVSQSPPSGACPQPGLFHRFIGAWIPALIPRFEPRWRASAKSDLETNVALENSRLANGQSEIAIEKKSLSPDETAVDMRADDGAPGARQSRFLREIRDRRAAENAKLEEAKLAEAHADSISKCEGKIEAIRRLLAKKASPIEGFDSLTANVRKLDVESNPPSVDSIPSEKACESLTNDEVDSSSSVGSAPLFESCPVSEATDFPLSCEKCEEKVESEVNGANESVEIVKALPEPDRRESANENDRSEPETPEIVISQIFVENPKTVDLREFSNDRGANVRRKESETERERKRRSKKRRNRRNNKKSNVEVSSESTSNSRKSSRNSKRRRRGGERIPVEKDVAFDSDADAKKPLYFSPETLQIQSPKQGSSGRDCVLSTSIDKCKNFLSTLNIVRDKTEKRRFSSTESEDCEGFDEIRGRFRNSESDGDQFVIVFSDSPREEESEKRYPKCSGRSKRASECESEESFEICFVGDGDDCYGNDDVYSDSATETGSEEEEEDDDSRSDTEEIATDSSGYAEENREVDSENEVTVVQCEDEPNDDLPEEIPLKLKSCLKKPENRRSPKLQSPERTLKKVTFDENKPTVHKMIAWAYAYSQARIGPWESCARDAERFKQRIMCTSVSIDWVFKREHRNRIFFQRFRPILMRALREEREAKAKEAARVKEEARIKLAEEEEARVRQQQEEEEEQKRVEQEEEDLKEITRQEKDENPKSVIIETTLNDSDIKDCLHNGVSTSKICDSNEMIANG